MAWALDIPSTNGLVATPIIVDGTLYLSAPFSVIHAVDAASGELLWSHDPQVKLGLSVPGSWVSRWNRGVQDVGIAITAFSGAQLRDLGISTPDELDQHVPGLMVTDFGNSYVSVFTLRGSSQLDFAEHQEPPVAVYLDGAYVSFIGGVGMAFYDLERAEVLKGPQGTFPAK